MDRNKFLIEKPQSVQKAEKVAAKKKAVEEKRKQELVDAAKGLSKKQSIEKEIRQRAAAMKKPNVTQRITLSNRAQPRETYYGGCGATRGGCGG